jgi:single-strand DNA-binding protein
MAGVNKVIIVGHLGRDPEIRYMQDGTAVASFSVATTETWKDKQSGEKKERTEWHRIVAWRQLGELCGKYLAKGRQVYIEGKLQTRSWEKDGTTHYMTEIVASEVQFLGSRDESATSRGRTPGATGSAGYGNTNPMGNSQMGGQTADRGYPEPPMPDRKEDDIPF